MLGPVLVNYLREYQIERHVDPKDAYSFVLYMMVGLLVVGLAANLLVHPVADKYFGQAEHHGDFPAGHRPSMT